MIRYVFEISGEVCGGTFACRADAVIGGHARLAASEGATVRVGERVGNGVEWIGTWTYKGAATWTARCSGTDGPGPSWRHPAPAA
jgi:hypothetical protein